MRIKSIPIVVAVLGVLASPGFAAPEHKNLQVLPKDISKDDLKAMMDGFTEQLGVKCTFCHVVDQYDKDERPHKADARRMIKLVLDMKSRKADYFGPRVKEAVITCSLCHGGKAEPEPFAAAAGAPSLMPQISFGASLHKNLQILPKDISKDELKKNMEGFTEQLGVKCTFCHVPDQFDKDERPHKADARRMIRLVADMKAKKADYFGPRVKEAVITCGVCHRGKAEPEPFVP